MKKLKLARAVVKDLNESPDDFKMGHYRLENKVKGYDIWVANGFWFIALMLPFGEVKFGAIGKVWVALAIVKWVLRHGKTEKKAKSQVKKEKLERALRMLGNDNEPS